MGRVALVTGANAGIGFYIASQLAQLPDTTVILAARNPEALEKAAAEIKAATKNENIKTVRLDLNSLASVVQCAKDVRALGLGLSILVNNAGIMATPYVQTEDGFEQQFQVNHLGHFLLTVLLLDLLKKSAPSRIINLSSRAHLRATSTEWSKSITDSKESYDAWETYGRSKLANILFTKALHEHLQLDPASAKGKVTVNAVHPGLVDTGLLGKADAAYLAASAIPVSSGAATPLYLAIDPEVEGISGEYYFEKAICADRSELSKSSSEATKLWAFSWDCILLRFPKLFL